MNASSGREIKWKVIMGDLCEVPHPGISVSSVSRVYLPSVWDVIWIMRWTNSIRVAFFSGNSQFKFLLNNDLRNNALNSIECLAVTTIIKDKDCEREAYFRPRSCLQKSTTFGFRHLIFRWGIANKVRWRFSLRTDRTQFREHFCLDHLKEMVKKTL